MLLSKLHEHEAKRGECGFIESQSSFSANMVWGVEVDELILTPFAHIVFLGLVCKFEDGTLSNDVLDLAIAHAINGVEVILEAPHDAKFDIEKLVIDASNGDFGVAFLAPAEDAGDSEWLSYMDRLAVAARLISQKKNIKRPIFPVSAFYEYLMGEVIDYTPQQMTTDAYIQDRYVTGWSIERLDQVKERLREAIYEAEGGRVAFEEKVKSIMYAVKEKMDEMARLANPQPQRHGRIRTIASFITRWITKLKSIFT